MRGKLAFRSDGGGGARLIPAHAGKTLAEVRDHRRPRAHPRACGENSKLRSQALPRYGSSPRMRGKQWKMFAANCPSGLIPAHAGKTYFGIYRWRPKPAHPRACGENMSVAAMSPVRRGSSPRMRGKPVCSCGWRGTVGLIPAHAGKTLSGKLERDEAGAHPRACGENTSLR